MEEQNMVYHFGLTLGQNGNREENLQEQIT